MSNKALEVLIPSSVKPYDIDIYMPKAETNFYVLAQSHSSNNLARKLTSKIIDSAQMDLYGNGRIESKDFKLFIRGYAELVNGINTSASKLLDSLLITATANGLNDTIVRLPLKEYMQMRNLKDEKETRKQVKRDIDALKRVSFEYVGQGKTKGNWLNVTLAGEISGIINGIIIFQFGLSFYNSLKINESEYLFMYFPKEALRLNDNANPYSYFFARKISAHKRMNIGKPNENIIRVHTLIEECKNFPTYYQVKALGGAVTKRMIDPFERDMDALSEAFGWEYIGNQPSTYQDFIDSIVRIIWLNYPNLNKLEKERTKRKKRTVQKKLNKKMTEFENKVKKLE